MLRNLKTAVVKYSAHTHAKDLLPEPVERITFDVKGHVSIANALRRTLLEELPVKCMIFYEMNSTDKSIPVDWLQNRMRCIPIEQRDFTAELKVHNKSANTMTVTAESIKWDGKPACGKTYRLFKIERGYELSIPKIETLTHYGWEHAAHSLVQDMHYRRNSDTTHMGFTTFGTMPAKNILHAAINNIIERLKTINDILATNDGEDQYGDNIDVIYGQDMNKIVLRGHTHTIAGLITWYIYSQDNSISLVNYALEHPTERNVIIKFRHDSKLKIVTTAINKCIADFASML